MHPLGGLLLAFLALGQQCRIVHNESLLHEVAFDGSQFKTSKGLKGDEGRDLPTDLGLILDQQIAVLMAEQYGNYLDSSG